MYCVSVRPMASSALKKKHHLIFGDSISDKLKPWLKNYELLFLLKIDPVFVHRRVRDNWKSGEKRKSEANIFRSSSCISFCCVMFTDELFNFKIIFCLFLSQIASKPSTTDMNFSFSHVLFRTPPFVMMQTEAQLRGIKDVVCEASFFEIWDLLSLISQREISCPATNFVSTFYRNLKRFSFQKLSTIHCHTQKKMSTDQSRMSQYFIMSELPLDYGGLVLKRAKDP